MKKVPLTKGQVAIVDNEDYRAIRRLAWHAKWNRGAKRWEANHSIGFAIAKGKRGCRSLSMSHFIAGKPPANMMIDHKNGNHLDFRRENLRIATRTQNNRNRRIRYDATGPFKGIKLTVSGTWQARIGVAGRRISLGTFSTPEEAARAYNSAARQHFGDFARLNIIHEQEKRVA